MPDEAVTPQAQALLGLLRELDLDLVGPARPRVTRLEAERVVAREVEGDPVQAVAEVVRVDDVLAAGLLGHVHDRRLDVLAGDRVDVRREGHALHRGVAGVDAHRTRSVDGVERDLVRVRRVDEVGEAPARVVLQRVEEEVLVVLDRIDGTAALVQRLPHVRAGPHRQPVRDIEESLAAGHARQRDDAVLESVERELHVVVDLLRVDPHAPLHEVVVTIFLADVADEIGPVRVPHRPAAGVLLQVVERVGDQLGVARELTLHLHRTVEGQEHDAIVAGHVLAQKLPDVTEEAVPVLGADVVVVDVDHQVQALVLGHDVVPAREPGPVDDVRLRLGRHQAGSRADLDSLVNLVEVRDRCRALLLQQDEVVLRQTGHGIAIPVTDEDLDVDHLDVDRVLEGGAGRPGRHLLAGEGKRSDQHRPGEQCRSERGRSE